MKDRHPTRSELAGYLTRSLAPEDLLMVDGHLSQCDSCRRMMQTLETFEPSALETFMQVDAAHLTFEQLSEIADGQADYPHAGSCDICTHQVMELRRLGEELAVPTVVEQVAAAKPQFWNFKRILLVPALGGLLVAGAIAFWLFSRSGNDDASISDAVAPIELAPNDPLRDPAEPEALQNVNTGPSGQNVVTLVDGGRKYELAPDGTVIGLEDPAFRASVAGALKTGELSVSDDQARLKQGTGTLMSGGTEGVPFAVIAPVGVLVESDRPQLRWRAVQGAKSYRVEIFDDNFNRVIESGDIGTTSWQPERALSRGKIYRWQVTAKVDDREVRSPVRPAPDARFKVIDGAAAGKLSAARSRYRNSHLILGIAYAEAGFLDEAEREFTQLVRQNPSSTAARRLLQKVRAAR